MQRIICVFACIALVSCGGSKSPTAPSGPQYPAISGTYRSTTFWQFRFASLVTGQTVNVSCAGEMTISQSSSVFSGTFRITGQPCDLVTGNVTQGQVRTDGGISFDTVVPGADPNAFTALTGCVFLSGSTLYNGLVSGFTLDASASGVISCPNGDRINITVRTLGTR